MRIFGGYDGDATSDRLAYFSPSRLVCFATLDVTPVLLFQWAKPAPDTVGALKDYLGPARYAILESSALVLDAGARVAYGSDWPVDPLNVCFEADGGQ